MAGEDDRTPGPLGDPDEEISDALPVSDDEGADDVPLLAPLGVDCPDCGLACDEGTAYCAGCGASLLRVCGVCDAEIPVHHRHCAGCGIPVEKLSRVEARLEGAREALAEGDPEACRDEYCAVLLLLRNEAGAAELTGTIQRRLHRVDERLGQRGRTLARIAELRSESRYSEALEVAETAAVTDPACPDYEPIAREIRDDLRRFRLRRAEKAEADGKLAVALTSALEAYSVEGPGQEEVRPVVERLRGRKGDLEEACRGIENLLEQRDLAAAKDACSEVARRVGISPALRQLRERAERGLAALDRHLRRGRSALEYDDWETAGRQFVAARKIAPGDPRPREGLREVTALRYRERLGHAEAALAARRWEEAVLEFEAAAKLLPDDPEAPAGIERTHRTRRGRKRRRIALAAAGAILLLAVAAAGPVAKMAIDSGSTETARTLYRIFRPIMIGRASVEEGLARPHLDAARERLEAGETPAAHEEFRLALGYRRGDAGILREMVAALGEEARSLTEDGDPDDLLRRLKATARAIPARDESLSPERDRVRALRESLEDRVRAVLVAGFAPERTWFREREVVLRFPAGRVQVLRRLVPGLASPVGCPREGDAFTCEVALPEPGLHRFEFLAEDGRGLLAPLSVDVGLDEEAPRIELDSEVVWTNRRDLDLEIPATDDSDQWGAGVEAAGAAGVDGGGEFPAGERDGRWIARVGVHKTDLLRLRLWARDRAGNEGSAEVEARFDPGIGKVDLEPALPVRDGVVVASSSPVELVARVAESGLALGGATRFDLDGGEAAGGRAVPVREEELTPAAGGVEVRAKLDLPEGRTRVRLHVVDPAGNEGDSEPVVVVVDRTPPVVEPPELVAPEGGVLRRDGSAVWILAPRPPALAARIREENPEAVTVNGEARTLGEDGALPIEVRPGAGRFTIEVRDRAGHTATETVEIGFFPLPPAVRVRDGLLYDAAGVEMVFVPGGSVEVDGEGVEPATVPVRPFLIDRDEARAPGGPADRPWVSVGFAEAAAFAARSGKDLPLEEEWLRAATATGLEGGALREMRGGVAEWVRAFTPSVPVARRVPALRGGISKAPSLARQPWPEGTGSPYFGFRCVIRLAAE